METVEQAERRVSGLVNRLRESTAAREGLLVLAAQGLATAIALGIDVVLFRELSKNERGTLSAALSLRNVMIYIADMGLTLTTMRVGAEYYGKGLIAEAHTIFRRALLARMLITALIVVVAILLSPVLSSAVLAASHRNHLVWAAALALFGMSASFWGVDVARSSRKFGLYFTHQVVEALLRAIAVVAVISLTGSPTSEPVLWFLAVAATAAGLFSVFLQRDVFQEHAPLSEDTRKKIYSELSNFGRYAWGIALLGTISTQVEVLLIQNLLRPEDTASYEGARRLALVLPLIAGAMTTVLLPRAAMLDTVEGCRNYARKALSVSVVLALLCAGGLAIGAGVVIPLFWGHRYDESIPLLRWLCVANGLMIVINPLALVFFPLQRVGSLLFVHFISLLLSACLGLIMIPRYGLIGAAWSALIVKIFALALVCGMLMILFRRTNSGQIAQSNQDNFSESLN